MSHDKTGCHVTARKRIYQTSLVCALKRKHTHIPFSVCVCLFRTCVYVSVQDSTAGPGHVCAAPRLPARSLRRAALRLPHPGDPRWEALGGPGRWIQRLVQLQAPGERWWPGRGEADRCKLTVTHLFCFFWSPADKMSSAPL